MADGTPIRIVIADDQEVIRRGLTIILEQEPGFQVVGQAGDGQQAVQLARALQPDVVLMDLKMPLMGGVQATQQITRTLADVQVVVLTTYDSDDLVFAAVRAGAQAYVLKETSSAELITVIQRVHQGESQLDPSVARKVLDEFRRLSPADSASTPATIDASLPALETLTEREAEILGLIAQGMSNREIVGALYLSEGTVKNYVSKIMAKLHANDRTQLVITALRAGMVKL